VTLNQLRRLLYMLARMIGDLNAVRRGPKAVAKRIARKAAGRQFGRIINKL
jgi:hypothetical protein